MPRHTQHLAYLLILNLFVLIPSASDAQELPETWQEQQDFRSGPTPFEPLMEFWFEPVSYTHLRAHET